MQQVDFCIVLPGLVEAPTSRGGGREEQHYGISIELSRYFNVVMISPFYCRYARRVLVNSHFTIDRVLFPSCKEYPPKSAVARYMNPISLVWYSFLASLNIIGLRKKGLKIVVTTDILTGVFPMLLSKLLRIKVIFSEGNLWPWVDTYTDPKELSENQKLMYSITIIASKFLRRLATRIRVQSNSIKEGMVRNGVPRERIDVVEGGVCVNEFIPASRIRPRDLNVGFIGRLTDEKGGSLLFKVCATAEKEIPDVNFLIYGDGSYRSSFELLRNVKHVGWVPRNRLAQLLSEIDVVMFFQRDLGIAVLEAMASGKAIVACDIGEISKVVQHLENGILCSANVNSCVDGIRLLYNNPLLIEKLSKKARETAINRFDWAVIGAKWINLCKECLETSNLDKTCSAGH